jgi:hypothetical protein
MAMEPAKPLDGEIEKPKRSGRKLAVVEPVQPPASLSGDAWQQMIERMAPVVGIEGIKELIKLRREEQSHDAERQLNSAMAAAKAEFQPIVKTHLVEYGEGVKKTSYKHEDLGDIAAFVDPILAAHGLFYRFRATSNLNEPISVTCILSHRLGHSEETTLRAGADNSGGKNSIQSMASTVTYLQRYTLRLALGIATARGDDDGRAAGAAPAPDVVSAEQHEKLKSLIVDTDSDIQRFCRYFKIDDVAALPARRFDEAVKMFDDKKRR